MTLNKQKQYTPDSFKAVAFPASSPEVFATRTDGGPADLNALLARAKQRPVTFGTAGTGTSPHIVAEYFLKDVAKVPNTHVPFQGGAPAINAVLGNQIDIISAILGGAVAAQINGGKFRGLAVTGKSRAPIIPDVPTFSELGYKDMDFVDWVGVFVPRDTQDDIVQKLRKSIDNVMADPEVVSRLDKIGFTASADSSKAQEEYTSDTKKWASFVDKIGLAPH